MQIVLISIMRKLRHFFSLEADQKIAKRYLSRGRYATSSGVILVEANQPAWNQLALSLFLPKACLRFDAHPVNYYLQRDSLIIRFKESIRQRFSVSHFYGISRFYVIGSGSRLFKKQRLLAETLAKSFTSKAEFEAFEYKGIRIGDLVYDQYLRAAKNPTLHFQDPLFVLKLAEAISFVDSLLALFDFHNVKAVCVSHTVYALAIPVRVAIKRNIPAFQVNGEQIYRLSATNSHAFTEFKSYSKEFQTISPYVRREGLELAKDRLQRRFSGEIGVDMPYSSASAYLQHKDNLFQLPKKQMVTILVAVHDFFDSPHSYGDNLFPDFMEWLDFLGKISVETNYDWFLKTHPDVVGDGDEILRNFVKRFPKFMIIPKEVSHHTLLSQGINVVLTIFGTIASEYAYLGKLAVNASVNNPHISYNFCLNPKSTEEFGNILLELEKLVTSFKPNQEEILEFYFMHHFNRLKSWIFSDLPSALQELGGYSGMLSWKVIKYYFEGSNHFKSIDIESALENYLVSEDYNLSRKHFPDFSEARKILP